MFEIIFEILCEFLVQIIGEGLLEGVFQKFSGPLTRKLNAILAVVVYFALGIITGWLSILIFPHSFIRSSKLHGISLVITPLLAGLTMTGIGWIRQRQGKQLIRLDTFGYAFVFAFGMALIRFLFTT